MSDDPITIYVVEDDDSIRFGLEEVLRGEGFRVESRADGDGAAAGIAEVLPDLVVLDVMLPGESGYEIARRLRGSDCRIPILMLTAKGEEMDKVVGLNAGADDYVTKPFGLNELLARIRALLRRTRDWSGDGAGSGGNPERIEIGRARVDPANYQAELDGETLSLTPRELELIRFFVKHRGFVLGRDRILEEVWGVRYFGTTRTLDQCVAQVRKKIGDDGRTPEYLLTIHGVGYKLL